MSERKFEKIVSPCWKIHQLSLCLKKLKWFFMMFSFLDRPRQNLPRQSRRFIMSGWLIKSFKVNWQLWRCTYPIKYRLVLHRGKTVRWAIATFGTDGAKVSGFEKVPVVVHSPFVRIQSQRSPTTWVTRFGRVSIIVKSSRHSGKRLTQPGGLTQITVSTHESGNYWSVGQLNVVTVWRFYRALKNSDGFENHT